MVAFVILTFLIWFISSHMAHHASTQLMIGRDCCDDMFFDERVKMATGHLLQSRRCKINAPNKFTAYIIFRKFPKSRSLTTLVISGPAVGLVLVLLMGRVGLWMSLVICVSIWDR